MRGGTCVCTHMEALFKKKSSNLVYVRIPQEICKSCGFLGLNLKAPEWVLPG